MKRTLAMTLMGCLSLHVGAQPAPSPRAKVEQRLAELLAPSAPATRESHASSLPPRKPLRSLENPEAPFKNALIPPPAPPGPVKKAIAPRTLPDEPPLVRSFGQPEVPAPVSMPTSPLVRLWSDDVHEPLPLPIMGLGVRDRASLNDPSLDASIAATQAPLSPARSLPVAFQPQNLPDPFEHVQAVRLRHPLDEAPEPPPSIRPFGR